VRSFPRADEGLIDEQAEREVEAVIEATRRLRRYRVALGAPAAARLPARLVAERSDTRHLYERGLATIQRLARFDFEISSGDGAELALAIPGAAVELLPSEAFDPREAKLRIERHMDALRAEIERAQGKLANPGFVDKAPDDVVQQEREKLERYERELAELDR
jgi:valyl-tRNA synthetase